jgi:hypothetical protein
MKVIFYTLLFLTSTFIQAQKVDYLKVRDDLVVLTCGEPIDSSDVLTSIRNLEALDTNKIKKHIHEYYIDLGTYYWLAGGLTNKDYADKSIAALITALYHQPNSPRAFWDLAFVYGFLYDCEKAKAYFALYHKNTRIEYQNEYATEQENNLLAKCESKN